MNRIALGLIGMMGVLIAASVGIYFHAGPLLTAVLSFLLTLAIIRILHTNGKI